MRKMSETTRKAFEAAEARYTERVEIRLTPNMRELLQKNADFLKVEFSLFVGEVLQSHYRGTVVKAVELTRTEAEKEKAK